LITSVNKEAAQLSSTDGGMTVSSKWFDQLLDLQKYSRYMAVKFYKKAAQKITKKSSYNRGSKIKGFPVHLLQNELGLECECLLKDAGIIKRELPLTQIHSEKVGNFISLALLLKFIKVNEGGFDEEFSAKQICE
jgi:hypothetical protein